MGISNKVLSRHSTYVPRFLFYTSYLLFFIILYEGGISCRAQDPAANAQPSNTAIVTLGSRPASFAPFVSAAGGNVTEVTEIPTDAGIVIFHMGYGMASLDADHAAMEAVLKKGGSVIFNFPVTDKTVYAFEDLAPVNFWQIENLRLRRLSTGAIAPAGSPMEEALKTPGFRLAGRFDLHLPYSTTETGQHRYEWERMGKSLLNTDWQVLATTDQDGRLPLLVEGRCYAGHVFIFGGDLTAPELTSWAGYPAFVKALINQAQPQPLPDGPAVDGLKLAVAPYQPGSGPLQITITNPGTSEVRAVLAGKIRTFTRGLMNSFSQEISVPAGKTTTIGVPEGAPLRDVSVAPPSGDGALPYRRLELGLARLDRQQIAVHLDAVVDRTPAVTLAVEGENVRSFPDTDGWAAGGINDLVGSGLSLDRYTYFCGQTPKVTLHLANGRHNIAPLAVASDVAWPENISAQGLNDGAVAYDSLRGKFLVMGYWSGRAAATQQVRLTWDMPVMVAGQRLIAQTDYRHWDRTNPLNYTLSADGSAQPVALATIQNATYTYGSRTDTFPPVTAANCTLDITGLDPTPLGEPSALRGLPQFPDVAINCSLGEWEIYGWPSATPPPKVKGHLKVTLRDLSDDHTSTLVDKDVALDPLTQSDFQVDLPTRETLGQVCVHAEFKPATGTEVTSDFPLLFVADKSPHLISRAKMEESAMGLLCSPGFTNIDDFGLGTDTDTQGWGGPDDKAWAWSHDMMEMGDPRNRYYPQRFLLSPVGMTHYTDPYRDFPSGQYGWDWATGHLVDIMTTGRFKGKKSLHVMLSDRWNGINVGSSFSWSDFVSYDEHLRAEGKPGLTGRTRADLWKEIVSQHSDDFQRYEMGRYADALVNTQKKMAEVGVDFTSETHGSFALAGGKLGAELATNDVGVGTDLFWELRDEDVFKGIGYRFGLVAVNPDLKSGAYDQWEWTSGVQQNATWFAPSGDVEPSRLQWYNTYWKGRITSDGTFQPYTVYGFSMQGSYGVKDTPDDLIKFNRVQSTMIWVRPDQPVGVGIVASWALQEKHMSPSSTAMGFGLYASNGYNPNDPHDHSGMHDQVDAAVGETYYRLVKNGVPISFVASTETLKNWKGVQPLVAVEGFETDPWEIAEFDRLNRTGVPIIALGSEGSSGRTEAEALFGVKKADSSWTPDEGTQVVNDAAGMPLAYICKRAGRGPTLFCPLPTATLDGSQSAMIAGLIQQLSGQPFELPYGVTAAPFISDGSLFVAFGNISDSSRLLDIAVRPSALNPTFTGQQYRVIDHDRAVVVPSEWKDGALHFTIPAAPNDGRMIQLVPLTKT
jgi:hypothetical protein